MLMNKPAVTPQNNRIIVIPSALVGSHGLLTFRIRSLKYDNIRTPNIIGNPRYMM